MSVILTKSKSSSGGGGGFGYLELIYPGNCYVGEIGFIDWGDSFTVSKISIQVGTAPTDATLIIDIHKNGITIFTNQAHRPQITTGNTSGNTTDIDVSAVADGDRYTIHIDQIGSTIVGANLTVRIYAS